MYSIVKKAVWATVWAVTMAITVYLCWDLTASSYSILAILVLAAFVESISLVYARQAWRQGNVITAVAALWITGLSLLTLVISESSYWSSVIEGIHEKITREKLLREGLDVVREKQRERYTSLASGKTPDQLQAEISAIKLDELFRRSASCTDVTQQDSRTFCQGYFRLVADYAAAKEAKDLEGVVWKNSTALETPMMQRNFYEFARLASENIGGSIKNWILAVIAVMVLLLQSLHLFALYIACAPNRPKKPKEPVKEPEAIQVAEAPAKPVPALPALPAKVLNAPPPRLAVDNTVKKSPAQKPSKKNSLIGDVDKWKSERLQLTSIEGGGAMTMALWEDYNEWCDRKGHRALAIAPFGKKLTNLGVNKKSTVKGSFRSGWVLKAQSKTNVA
jgi:hypothetical protein